MAILMCHYKTKFPTIECGINQPATSNTYILVLNTMYKQCHAFDFLEKPEYVSGCTCVSFITRLLVNQLCAIACEDYTNIEEAPILPFNSADNYQRRPNVVTKDYIRTPQ